MHFMRLDLVKHSFHLAASVRSVSVALYPDAALHPGIVSKCTVG